MFGVYSGNDLAGTDFTTEPINETKHAGIVKKM